METQNHILFEEYSQGLSKNIVFESSREIEQELIDELILLDSHRKKYMVFKKDYNCWVADENFMEEYVIFIVVM